MAQANPVVVLCGDAWHPAEMVRGGLSPVAGSDFVFEWFTNDAREFVPALNGFRLMVLAKANVVSPEDKRPWLASDSQAAFRDHVRQGSGLLVVHGGISGYDKLPAACGMIGGVFLSHPPQCSVTIEPKPGHPLTGGVAPFTLIDEHYQVALDDSQVDVFLHSRSEHGMQPAGWTRTEGAGRVCVLTPGHNMKVWLHPCFQALLRNALRWIAKMS